MAVRRRQALWIAPLVLIAGGLAACGGQASPSATSLPASTVSVQETVASAPAGTDVAAPPAGGPNGTPEGAIPLTEVNPERLAADCAVYTAWLNDPEVKTALEKASLWPEVIAQGEKAAAGEPVDTAAMKQDFDQMAKLGKSLRTSDVGEGDHAPLQLAGRAMGLTSRLASSLSEGNLDAQAAGTAVAEARAAIAAYEEDAAARQASCG